MKELDLWEVDLTLISSKLSRSLKRSTLSWYSLRIKSKYWKRTVVKNSFRIRVVNINLRMAIAYSNRAIRCQMGCRVSLEDVYMSFRDWEMDKTLWLVEVLNQYLAFHSSPKQTNQQWKIKRHKMMKNLSSGYNRGTQRLEKCLTWSETTMIELMFKKQWF